MKNLAIFASGSGTNFESIVKSVENGFIKDASVLLLVCDKKDAYVIERAHNHNIETLVFNPKDYKKRSEYEAIIVKRLNELDIDLICLAGYMRICGKTLLDAYPNKIINIHPALLPSFKGAHGIEDAFNYGVKVFGVTVHYVSSELDGGRIISQQAFEYYGDDIEEVEANIHMIEHKLYPKTINWLLKGDSNESFN